MDKASFLPVLRELARCYQAFEQYSSHQIRAFGLTPAQFDIVATLGNTTGMSFRQLGEKTLITKGTLTGVVDRLEMQGLVRRVHNPNDRRSQTVCLTEQGQLLFERVFPQHVNYLAEAFVNMTEVELAAARQVLQRLRQTFTENTDASE